MQFLCCFLRLNGNIREAVYCYGVKSGNAFKLSEYLFWLNRSSKILEFEYEEIPNVRHALRCI
jgi:hypothetical protein